VRREGGAAVGDAAGAASVHAARHEGAAPGRPPGGAGPRPGQKCSRLQRGMLYGRSHLVPPLNVAWEYLHVTCPLEYLRGTSLLQLSYLTSPAKIHAGRQSTVGTTVGEGGVARHELAGAVLREPAHSGPDGLRCARRQGAWQQGQPSHNLASTPRFCLQQRASILSTEFGAVTVHYARTSLRCAGCAVQT